MTAQPLPAVDEFTWDLLVVGAGTAGLVAARTAAGLGARVLLVESGRWGGDCLWTGCVPSKALLSAAHAAAAARSAGRLGVDVEGVRVDFGRVMQHVRESIRQIEPVDSPAWLLGDGVHVAQGHVALTGDGTAVVDATPVTFRHALLATGSAPQIPSIDGLAAADPLTSDTVWDLAELPARLLVVGGGSIGCELGQAFARLGSAVTLVESRERLLADDDPDASAVLTASLRADGVSVRTSTALDRVRVDGSSWRAESAGGTSIDFDQVLIAVGRAPRTRDIGLAQAGVDFDDRGYVRVDAQLRTTSPRIWAAGDVTGHPAFTHVAGVHGSLAASNAVLGLRRTVDLRAIPRVTYTQPEIASVGIPTGDPNQGLTVRTIQHRDADRAVVEGEQTGFTRLLLDRKGLVVGGTIVGPRAGESLAELVLAISQKLRGRDLAGAIHAYPTYSDGVWKAAIEQVQAQLRRPAARVGVAMLRLLQRRRAA